MACVQVGSGRHGVPGVGIGRDRGLPWHDVARVRVGRR